MIPHWRLAPIFSAYVYMIWGKQLNTHKAFPNMFNKIVIYPFFHSVISSFLDGIPVSPLSVIKIQSNTSKFLEPPNTWKNVATAIVGYSETFAHFHWYLEDLSA